MALYWKYFQIAYETGMRVRAGLVTTIYRKALVLSNDGAGKSSGDIVNLMSVDATRLQDLCTYGLIAISGPFQVRIWYYIQAKSRHLLTYLPHPDNSCFYLPIQHFGLACVCRGGDYDLLNPFEHGYCSIPEKDAREADEEPGSTH